MALDAEVLKQLVATFKQELEERLQTITDGLCALEKSNPKKGATKKIIEEIFRAAHNIKGSARSIGITHVGEIAHHIESLFTAIKENSLEISPEIINLCLASVDAMHSAMQSYSDQQPLSFDLDDLLNKLQQREPIKLVELLKVAEEPQENSNKLNELHEYETIRVSLSQIDKVSTLVEQMQINKIGIEEHYNMLKKLAIQCKQISRLNMEDADQFIEMNYLINQMCQIMNNKVNELGVISNSLQEEIRMLRLVPASTLLRHFTRYVRDLSQELDKSIEFEISGDMVKLDKMILEGLKDPIIHLLRNAVDHAIESPEIRKKMGKSAVGKIKIDVLDEGNQILININDDGVGIDAKLIAATALKKKIMTQAELDTMHEDNILALIFKPEFSTKEIITDISGRGVGLDVVKSNLSELKGSVTLTTELGKGTTFHLHLPLTLSSDIGLTIKSADQLFVIPVSSIERVMMMPLHEVQEVEASQIILLDQKPIPLCILSRLLNLEGLDVSKQGLPIVVIKKGRDKIALMVEEIIGEREIVIKPLQAPLTKVSCVAGGTLSGTGEVIIVLNPGEVINNAIHFGQGDQLLVQTETIKSVASQHHILLVEDSITTRTLEKNILESNHYKVTIAVDGKEAWEQLQKQSFSLVITDVEMPNVNGFELTELIKKSNKYKDIPVIIVTSLGSEEQKRRGIEVGANAYIVKRDFESTELLEVVNQLV